MPAHRDPPYFAIRQSMTASWAAIDINSNTMPIYVCTPDQEIFGDVIVLMEAFGLTDHVRDICEKLATEGFRAIAPDLYHFRGTQQVFTQETLNDSIAAMRELTDARARQMVDSVIEWRDQKHLPLFLLGMCMGGRLAWAIGSERHAFDAVVCFYGSGIGRIEATPHCPVFLAYGEQDPLIPGSERLVVRERLEKAGIAHQLQVYLNAGHGFLCADREGYHREAAAHAFTDATTFMRETIMIRQC
jgi:carboxymethylenebutenolidase